MRRLLGAVLVLGGAYCLFRFAVLGTLAAQTQEAPILKIPFLSLGNHYPKDALWMLGAFWGLGLGLVLMMGGGAKPAPAPVANPDSPAARFAAKSTPKCGGRIARVFFLNALLAVSMLFLAYLGARVQADQAMIGVFFGTGLLQIAFGLILLILSIFEKPKGAIPLILGTAVWLGATAIGVLAFLWGA